MNGTEALVEVLAAAGVRYLFGNPGHTELPLLDVLAGREGPQYVLGLNEAVAMAMADGYAMASGRLGVFCAHITPGLGNALGMLYDASRTGAPVLVLAGQQDGRFAFTEPALWGDLVALARPLVKWAYQVERPDDLPRALRRAIKVATTPPAGPVALTLPREVLAERLTEVEYFDPPRLTPPAAPQAPAAAVQRAAEWLVAARAPLVIAKALGRDPAAVGPLVEVDGALRGRVTPADAEALAAELAAPDGGRAAPPPAGRPQSPASGRGSARSLPRPSRHRASSCAGRRTAGRRAGC